MKSRFWLSTVFIWLLILGSHIVWAWQSPDTGSIPEPMPLVDTTGQDVMNFLLLGSDTLNPRNSGRTDAIMVISINRTYGTAALLSIPRDLYVYVPDTGMQRINTVYGMGEQAGEGRGPELLIDTILYNLGLRIDRYARVDFVEFKQIIDAVGGIDISVDCAIQDWRLIEPQLDPTEEANWALFTLPIGVHHMDGDLALWYARSRRTSSDFDRGQRQQEIMRALWGHLRTIGLLEQLPDIWSQLMDVVETDISLVDMAGLIPFASALEPGRVSSLTFHLNREVVGWTAPDKAQVLLPQREALLNLIQDFVTPSTEFQLALNRTKVRVSNVSGNPALAVIAADRLRWQGFQVQLDQIGAGERRHSVTLYDYSGVQKGRQLDKLKTSLRIPDGNVIVQPDVSREFDYEVFIGSSYYPCTRDILPPTDESAES